MNVTNTQAKECKVCHREIRSDSVPICLNMLLVPYYDQIGHIFLPTDASFSSQSECVTCRISF